jgi:hypothetical protein
LLTAVASLLAIGSLGALVVVASVKKADVLATVALALAVLAFVIQILVFVAQTWAASQQTAQSQAVNADTRALLSELQTQTRDTNSVLTNQYNKLLDRVLLETKDELGSVVPEETAELRELLTNVVERLRPTATPQSSPRPSTTPANLRIWPSKRTIEALKDSGLDELSEPGKRLLKRFAEDLVKSVEGGIIDGLGVERDDPVLHELLTGQYLKRANADSGDETLLLAQLTPKGRAAAKLFNAWEPIPASVQSAFPWITDLRE